MTDLNATSPLSELRSDGDTVDLGDGRKLRLRIEPDTDMSVLDDQGDFYGRLAWVEGRRTHDYVGGHDDRPEGFDGAAEILRGGRNFDPIWWQPPEDAKRDAEMRSALRSAVVELLEFGYCGLVLEILDGTDAYGRPIVTGVASLWGIEPFPDAAYVAEVVRDLADELGVGK